ncbi:MAG: EAL domain-containing protein [Colwellia sp.]|nr:EAL domain-containing protein [Colwellia sp.]
MKNRTNKELALLSSTAITAIVILPIIGLRIFKQEYFIALADLFLVIMLISTFTYSYRTRKVELSATIIAVFASATWILLLFLKGFSYAFWAFPLIIAAFYLLRPLFALLLFICSFSTFFINTYLDSDWVLMLVILPAYTITSAFAYIFSVTVEINNSKIQANQRLSRYRNEILELIVNSSSLKKVLRAIVSSAELEFKEVRCSILLLNEARTNLTVGAGQSLPDFYNQAIEGVAIGEGVGSCGSAAFTGKRVIVEDIATHAFWAPWAELAAKAKLGACWSEPIISSSGDVIGTFAIYHEQKSSPTKEQFDLIDNFSQLASIAIERVQANKAIWRHANFDSLTGLPNRNMMREHLALALRTCQRKRTKLAIIFLDLDNFKDVNDTLGHDVGDALLVEVAKRIKSVMRENDIVARLGGDEFVVIINELVDLQGLNSICQKIISKLSTPYSLVGETIHTSGSLGVTIYPDDATNIDILLKNADQAMYSAKSLGRENYQFFTASMRDAINNRVALINDIRKAIDNEEFSLVYQPIINLSNNEIYKAEVLIRWNHPSKGFISPELFIPLAEETGLIIEISDWVFKAAIETIDTLRTEFHPDFQLSINTSPLQYQADKGNIINWLVSLQKEGIAPGAIALEITENLLMESGDKINDMFELIHNAGIAISIDDFGTGYSSLSYLKLFKANYLKIDKSFVQKMVTESDDLALCEAIIMMANKLKMKVIAEGIETEQQQQLLQQLNCEYGQGYFFAKPLPFEQFKNYLAAKKLRSLS